MLKYHAVKSAIKKDCKKLGPDEPLAPVRTLIKKYAVSPTTVNRALADLEKENVIVRKRGCGTFANKNFRAQSNFVGVIFGSLANEFVGNLLSGIEEAAHARGKRMVFYMGGHHTAKDGIDIIREDAIFDFIISPLTKDLSNIGYIQMVQKLAAKGARIVVLDNPVPGVATDFVGLDNHGAFYEATKHLLHAGCSRIAFIGRSDSIICAERLNGASQALSGDVDLVLIDSLRDSEGVIGTVFSENIDGVLLARADVSVTLCYQLHAASLEHKRSLKIAGIVEDNRRLPGPNALTIEKPGREMGKEATEILLTHREAGSQPVVKFLPMKFHRESKQIITAAAAD